MTNFHYISIMNKTLVVTGDIIFNSIAFGIVSN
jgi:hypothetical protein